MCLQSMIWRNHTTAEFLHIFARLSFKYGQVYVIVEIINFCLVDTIFLKTRARCSLERLEHIGRLNMKFITYKLYFKRDWLYLVLYQSKENKISYKTYVVISSLYKTTASW